MKPKKALTNRPIRPVQTIRVKLTQKLTLMGHKRKNTTINMGYLLIWQLVILMNKNLLKY